MRGRGHGEPTARAQDAAGLRDEELHVADVLDRLGAEHEIKGAVGERELRVGRDLDELEPRRGEALARALERDGVGVRGDDVVHVEV